MHGSPASILERTLSRRELMSSFAGLGVIMAAGAGVAEQSPVVRPTPGQNLVYDDFSAGVWPSPRWMKFRTAEYDLWDPETKVHSLGAPQSTLTIDLPRFYDLASQSRESADAVDDGFRPGAEPQFPRAR
jgi:hypothetical protein